MNLRERNLEAARGTIRSAALASFLEDGFVTTTMSGIARRAGVARQTVYNLFESKATLLVEVIQAQVAGAPARDQVVDRAAVLASPDPREMLRGFAASHRGVVERTAPVIRVALQAAIVDEAVGVHVAAMEETRVGAVSAVVDALHAAGALRTDASLEELRRGFALLTSPSVAVAALDSRMTLDELEVWTRTAAEGLLLGR